MHLRFAAAYPHLRGLCRSAAPHPRPALLRL